MDIIIICKAQWSSQSSVSGLECKLQVNSQFRIELGKKDPVKPRDQARQKWLQNSQCNCTTAGQVMLPAIQR